MAFVILSPQSPTLASSMLVSDEDWLFQPEMNLGEWGSNDIPPATEHVTEVSLPADISSET